MRPTMQNVWGLNAIRKGSVQAIIITFRKEWLLLKHNSSLAMFHQIYKLMILWIKFRVTYIVHGRKQNNYISTILSQPTLHLSKNKICQQRIWESLPCKQKWPEWSFRLPSKKIFPDLTVSPCPHSLEQSSPSKDLMEHTSPKTPQIF